jgi:hypothetical protein
MKAASWKDTIKRAGRTFFQAFAGYVAANIVTATTGITDFGVLKTALIGIAMSAIAAGLAAVMNLPAKQ